MRQRKIRKAVIGAIVFGAVFAPVTTWASGFTVQAYYGSYNVATKKSNSVASSLKGPKKEQWMAPKADKPYHIGVSFPHLKDPYWLAVDYGIVAESRALGINMDLVAANGYNDLTGQINQVQDLANRGENAIVLGAISYSAEDQLVASLKKKGIPVIEVINDIRAKDIAAKTLVSFYTMGYKAGEHVAQDSKGKRKVTAAFLPGPSGSGWAPQTLAGFKQALKDYKASNRVHIVAVKWGDTGPGTQTSIIQNVMNAHPNLDYLVGNAVAANAATHIFSNMKGKKPEIVSTYLTPPVYQDVKDGKIGSASDDFPQRQGRMAIDAAVRILNGQKAGQEFPFRAGPDIISLTPANIKDHPYAESLGPKGWRPVFHVRAK